MPASATLGTATKKAFAIPQGMAGAIIQNRSAIDVYYNVDAAATTNDVLLPAAVAGAPSQVALTFPQPLVRAVQVHALAASGTPVLNYILLPSGE